jgi:hypothetical protein
MRSIQRFVTIALLLSFLTHASYAATETFDNIELMTPNGDKLRETSVQVEFGDGMMRIMSRGGGATLKEWRYDEIKAAEYSYSKNPRWKTGLGLGAAGLLFPPLLLIAIPVGFTKHRRHWVTIRTGNDFAVLKVGKSVRKVFMPAFETRTSIPIKALGDDK